jgi:hypothetical protein
MSLDSNMQLRQSGNAATVSNSVLCGILVVIESTKYSELCECVNFN